MKTVLTTLILLTVLTLNTFAQYIPYIELTSGGAYSVAFSPDGTTIASGSGETIRLWNANTGEHLGTLIGHRESVWSVAFSPDGTTIASGSYGTEHAIRLWNANTGRHLRTLTGHRTGVSKVAFSPDGTTIASGSHDNTIRLWDANTGEHLRTLGHPKDVYSVAFSPDGNTIASGSEDNTIRLWVANTGEHLRTLIGHRDSVYSVAFSPDGNTITSGSSDNTIHLWDANTGEHLRTLIGHRDSVNSVAFSPDGNTIASGSSDNTIRLWDANTGKHLRTLTRHSDSVYSVAFSPDGNTIASGSGDLTRLWDISNLIKTSAHVNINPSSVISPAIGKQFTVSIDIVGGRDIRGYQFTISYNSNTLRYVSDTPEDYLPGDIFEVATIQSPAQKWVIEDVNSDGVVDIADLIWVNQGLARQWTTPAQVTLTATSLGGAGSGDGTLASVTFEVVERKVSTFILSGFLSNSSGRKIPFIVKYGKVIEPPWDVNGDGVVNVLDLSFVAARFGQDGVTEADVNGDGVVDIQDLVIVASGIEAAAAAPSAYPQALAMFTAADVQQWLNQAQQLNLTDATSQRGILFLGQLLAALTLKKTSLLANYPNPFNPETWMPYQLATPADVSISIYTADGKLVRTLDIGHQTVGIYQGKNRAVHWDGKNAHGESVASGVYFYTLKADDFSTTRKMLIRK